MQHAFVGPLLKPAVACLIRRVSPWRVGPRCARAQDPQHAIEHIAWIPIGPSTLLADPPSLAAREARPDRIPLLIREVHPHL